MAPARASAKPEMTEAVKEGGRGATTSRRRNQIRSGLVIAETALALVLLVGAGLLMKSYVRLQNVDPGFNPHNVLTLEISLPQLKYPSPGAFYLATETTLNFCAEANRRIATLPAAHVN